MKVYISKYALTKGIEEANVTDKDITGEMVAVRGVKGLLTQYFHKGEWHKTQQQAIEKAEQMRLARIASLKKQIEKLEKLKFV